MNVRISIDDYEGWSEDTRALVTMAKAIGARAETVLEHLIACQFEATYAPTLEQVDEVIKAHADKLEESFMLETGFSGTGELSRMIYRGNRYWYLDVDFGKAGTFSIGDERFSALNEELEYGWRTLDDEIYAYVPLEVLVKGQDAVIAYMVRNGIDLPEEP